MALSITHTAVVTTADDGTSPVGSDEWNDTHTVTGLFNGTNSWTSSNTFTSVARIGAVGGTTGYLSFAGSRAYSGASDNSNSFLYSSPLTLSGTATASADTAGISPFSYYISGDTVNASASPYYLSYMLIRGVPGAGHKGGRVALNGQVIINGSPTSTPAVPYTSVVATTTCKVNLGGATGAYTNYAGVIESGNSNTIAQTAATFLERVGGHEIDVTVDGSSSTAEKYGLVIAQSAADATRGTYDDTGITFQNITGASTTWTNGISFGGYGHLWAFDTDSTLITAQQRQSPSTDTPVADTGIDFTAVTFTSYSLNMPGFTVDPSGNTTANSIVASTAALATNATSGFLYIPTCAGTPTGTPAAKTGTVPLIYDTTNNILYIYNGGAWKGGTNPGAFT